MKKFALTLVAVAALSIGSLVAGPIASAECEDVAECGGIEGFLRPSFPGEKPCFTPAGRPYYTPGAEPCFCFAPTGAIAPC